MSLTSTDLQAICQVVQQALITVRSDITSLSTMISLLESKVDAQLNDIQEIYDLLVFNGLDIFTD